MGTHLFETDPSANFYEYTAMAIGAKCQSAKTYLEKNFKTFNNVSRDELITHGVKALKASAQENELTIHNVSVGVSLRMRSSIFLVRKSSENSSRLHKVTPCKLPEDLKNENPAEKAYICFIFLLAK